MIISKANSLTNYFLSTMLPFCMGMFLMAASFTSLRGSSGTGPLEALLYLSLLLMIFFKVINKFDFKYIAILPLAYLIIFMTPITFLNTALDLMGSSVRTLIALIFGGIAAFAIANTNEDEKVYISYGMFTVLAIAVLVVLVQYDFQTVSRLLFLSNNPNQIALYSLGAMFLFSISFKKPLILFCSIAAAFIYGSLSLSDSFLLSVLIAVSFLLLEFLLKGKLFFLLVVFWIVLFLVAFQLTFPDNSFIRPLLELWSSADEGGGRVTLATNGLSAFFASPIFGNGAGAFSGTVIPFTRYEAHNTIIDFLTMGGIPWVLLAYLPFILATKTLFQQGNSFALGLLVAFCIFSLFHFVGRHPIFWFVWGYCISMVIKSRE